MTATVPTLAEPTRRSNRPPTTRALIRVAVLDDHAAVRAGLEAIVGSAPGIVSVGSAHDEAGLEWLLQRADPSVLILDVHHPGRHGLALSVRLKRRSTRPRIVLYSGRGGELLRVAAAVAGVDAVVAKSDTERALLEAIRDVARAENRPPAVPLSAQRRAAARLDPADHPILAMRLAGNSWADVAATLRQPVGLEQSAGVAVERSVYQCPAFGNEAVSGRRSHQRLTVFEPGASGRASSEAATSSRCVSVRL